MDVFDLIGGERSDISDWEDEESDESEESEHDPVVQPQVETVQPDAPAISQDNEDVAAKNEDDGATAGATGHETDVVEDVEQEFSTEPGIAAIKSKEGDALNLFTINPVSKADAKDYADMLGIRDSQDAEKPVPHLTVLPWVQKHPELDVLVVDNVFTPRECEDIIATVCVPAQCRASVVLTNHSQQLHAHHRTYGSVSTGGEVPQLFVLGCTGRCT